MPYEKVLSSARDSKQREDIPFLRKKILWTGHCWENYMIFFDAIFLYQETVEKKLSVYPLLHIAFTAVTRNT